MSSNYAHAKFAALLAVAVLATLAAETLADPLPGRDRLKFSQQPMVQTPIPDGATGAVIDYYGHDELSTAYGGLQAPVWDGRFMADDFGDKIDGDILHVKWWGSYLGAAQPQNPDMPVDKFLISFESDVPAPVPGFSRPGQPLLNQVVNRGPLAPGSGTFTEKLVRGPDPVLGEALYEYNAELHLGKEFFQNKDTVYWLKIVAMVDDLPGVTFDHYNPQNSPFPVTQWGWHNRDYTLFDNEASQNIPIAPFGEHKDGTIGGVDIWHFQDDAVEGNVRIAANAAMGIVMPDVFQDPQAMMPTHYRDFIDGPANGIPGELGIGFHSKDLAFELYTYSIPEPASVTLLGIALITASAGRRRRG